MKRIVLLITIALSASAAFATVTSGCHQQSLKMERKHCNTLKKGHTRNACIKRVKAHKKACHPVKKHHKTYQHAVSTIGPAIQMPKAEEMTTGKDVTPVSTPTAAQ
ncbi:MAG: hypothetical protein Q8L78_09435 [Coxiellaceae bacterium]|nr:hypothetical protein [Coxiellaceae bacterium]